MWKLYKLLGLHPSKDDEEFLLNESLNILTGISTKDFLESMKIMYGKELNPKKSSIETAKLFVKGLRESEIFSFSQFIKGLNGSSN